MQLELAAEQLREHRPRARSPDACERRGRLRRRGGIELPATGEGVHKPPDAGGVPQQPERERGGGAHRGSVIPKPSNDESGRTPVTDPARANDRGAPHERVVRGEGPREQERVPRAGVLRGEESGEGVEPRALGRGGGRSQGERQQDDRTCTPDQRRTGSGAGTSRAATWSGKRQRAIAASSECRETVAVARSRPVSCSTA